MRSLNDINTGDELSINVKEILETLRRHWKLAVSVILVTVISALIATALTEPKYSAQVMIEYRTKDAQSAQLGQLFQGIFEQADRALATQSQLITTKPVLTKVVQRSDKKIALDSLAKSIEVKTKPQTNLLIVTVTRNDPYEAASLAGLLASSFIENAHLAAAEDIRKVRKEVSYKIIDTEEDIVRLTELLDKYPPIIEGKTSKPVKQVQLESRLALANSLYGSLRDKHEQLRVAEQLATGSLRLVDPASVPKSPISPNVMTNFLMALVLGGILSGCFIFIFEKLDNSFKSVDDVRRSLSLPILGEIPLFAGNTIVESKSTSSEAFRALRTNIQFCEIDRQLKTILITSPQMQDGKSSISSNLAAILAFGGQKVIAIDADMRRPTLQTIFKSENKEGLSSILASITPDLDPVIKSTEIDNLEILTSGYPPPNPSEMLNSGHMTSLLESLKEIYDFILIDSPPVGLVTDAAILATKVDGVLMVISEGSTSRDAAKRALANLQQIGAPLLGIVYNKVSAVNDHYYYYYGPPRRSDKKLSSRAPIKH